MTINNIINLNGRLSAIINNDNITDPALKFKLLTIMKQLEMYIKNYETVKNSLIEKYGTLDDNNVVRVDKNVDEMLLIYLKKNTRNFYQPKLMYISLRLNHRKFSIVELIVATCYLYMK